MYALESNFVQLKIWFKYETYDTDESPIMAMTQMSDL